jgi:hypothetical protein
MTTIDCLEVVAKNGEKVAYATSRRRRGTPSPSRRCGGSWIRDSNRHIIVQEGRRKEDLE